MKPKIVFTLGDRSGCGWYRVILPALALKQTGEFDIQIIDRLREVTGQVDVLVVQRCVRQEIYDMVQAVRKRTGCKVIHEFDDDLWRYENFIQQTAKSPEERIPEDADLTLGYSMNEQADQVWVTNWHLGAEAATHGARADRVKVLPNALVLAMWRHERRKRSDGKVTIGWFGSKTHRANLQSAEVQLLRIDRKLAGLIVWRFLGYALPLTRHMKNPVFVETWLPVERYHKALLNVPIDIAVLPLLDTSFNRSKSDIKIIECWASGAVPVASDVRPYADTIVDQINGILVPDGEFVGPVERLVRDQGQLEWFRANGSDSVKKHQLERVTQARVQYLREVLDG